MNDDNDVGVFIAIFEHIPTFFLLLLLLNLNK